MTALLSAVLLLLVPVGSCLAQVRRDTIYANFVYETGSQWDTEARAVGPVGNPDCDPCACSTSSCAMNTVATGVRKLFANFDSAELPADLFDGSRVITRVNANVNGRFNGGSGGSFDLLVTVYDPLGNTLAQRQLTPNAAFSDNSICDWRIPAPDREITTLWDWNADPGSLGYVELGVSRHPNGNTNDMMVNGFRMIVDSVPGPRCSFSASSLNFGQLMMGGWLDQPVTLTNSGGYVLIGTPTLSSTTEFSISSGGQPFTLQPGEQTTINLRYRPTCVQNSSAYLSAGCANYASVTLNGNSVPPLAFSAADFDFGSVPLGGFAEVEFQLTNVGTIPWDDFSVGLFVTSQEPGPSCFDASVVQGGGLVARLSPGQSRTVRVRFAPVSPGAQEGGIHVNSALPAGCSIYAQTFGEPKVRMTGAGFEAGEPCVLSPGYLDFGDVPAGRSAERTLTLANVSGQPQQGTLVSENHLFSFVSGGGSYSLAAGQSRQAIVRFAPTRVDTAYATISAGCSPGALLRGTSTTLSPRYAWPMRLRDMGQCGRADFVVPADRKYFNLFDSIAWQKPSPGSPLDGGFGATAMCFYDGAGPGGADLIVGTYHWPKGIQAMDRHTGRLFWSGLPAGGESIGDIAAAFSPDGATIYVTNDATQSSQYPAGTPFMALSSTQGIAAYRHNGAMADAAQLSLRSPVVAPAGELLGYGWAAAGAVGVDDGTAIRLSHRLLGWPEPCFADPAAFIDAATQALRVVVTGRQGRMFAYTLQGSVMDVSADWSRNISGPAEAAPTVDAAHGRIYCAAGIGSIYVNGMDTQGHPLWGSGSTAVYNFVPGQTPEERAQAAGCLSFDGSTYYFQTNGQAANGALYAIRTVDGSLKWRYPTGSLGWEEVSSSPIVTRNGVIIVGNNRGGTYFAIQDTLGRAVVLDTFGTATGGDAHATATLSPEGFLYLPVRTTRVAGNGDGESPDGAVGNFFTCFDIRSQGPPASGVPAPAERGATPRLDVPNPVFRAGVFRLTGLTDGIEAADLFDISGAPRRRLMGPLRGPRELRLVWDGRDDAGRPLPTGIYILRVMAAGRRVSAKVVFVK